MPFSIHPATSTDISDLATVFRDAFTNDPILSFLMPNVPPETQHAYYQQEFQHDFAALPYNGYRYFKVVEGGTGKTVAYSRWQYPRSRTAEQRAEKEMLGKARRVLCSEGFNMGLDDEFVGASGRMREKWVDERRDYILSTLAVSPTHQRLGLASLLLKEGLAVPDRANARTYIQASPVAVPLYLKHGWRQVDDILFDMRPHGGKGISSDKVLFREPGGK